MLHRVIIISGSCVCDYIHERYIKNVYLLDTNDGVCVGLGLIGWFAKKRILKNNLNIGIITGLCFLIMISN